MNKATDTGLHPAHERLLSKRVHEAVVEIGCKLKDVFFKACGRKNRALVERAFSHFERTGHFIDRGIAYLVDHFIAVTCAWRHVLPVLPKLKTT
jgi:hypothetical protein